MKKAVAIAIAVDGFDQRGDFILYDDGSYVIMYDKGDADLAVSDSKWKIKNGALYYTNSRVKPDWKNWGTDDKEDILITQILAYYAHKMLE